MRTVYDITSLNAFSVQLPTYSPMIAFCPANAALVAVMSAFPRLISGRSGRLGVEAVMGIGYYYDP